MLLGARKVIVKGHGSSKASAFAVCIEQAYRMEQTALGTAIETLLAQQTEGGSNHV